MAKRPLVHCRICKNAIDRDNQNDWMMAQKNFYYHISCYEDFAKKRGAIAEKDITVEVDDDMWRDAVYDYLTKDLKMSINFVKFKSQWDNFLKKDMTAKGIYFTLRYFYEIKKGDKEKSGDGIGIVPHVYNEGTEYWGNRNIRDKGICQRIESQILKSIEAEKNTKIIIQPREKKTKKVDFSVLKNLEATDNDN